MRIEPAKLRVVWDTLYAEVHDRLVGEQAPNQPECPGVALRLRKHAHGSVRQSWTAIRYPQTASAGALC
jgi:hypothetical protein